MGPSLPLPLVYIIANALLQRKNIHIPLRYHNVSHHAETGGYEAEEVWECEVSFYVLRGERGEEDGRLMSGE
jgi:hypothetical protein